MSHHIIEEIQLKYSEWIEMYGDNAPHFINNILASLLQKEKDQNAYYKKLINRYENSIYR